MSSLHKTQAIAALVFLVLSFTCTQIKAEFIKSDHQLFVNWLDLEVEPSPIPPMTEFGAYAIVETGGENLPVIYIIFSSFKGKRAVHGAFRCDKEFEVQETHQNGFYDIRCVKQDVFGVKTVTSLKYNKSGLYAEHF